MPYYLTQRDTIINVSEIQATVSVNNLEIPLPLKKLVLTADQYRIIISGSAGSSLHLYFELVPLPAGKG